MKTLLASLFVVMMATFTPAAAPAELRPVEKLIKQGNHREAIGALKAVLMAPESKPELVAAGVAMIHECTQPLGWNDEHVEIIEMVVKAHPQWRVLLAAAKEHLRYVNHYGRMVGDKFTRNQGNEGRWTQATNRDRIRTLQLLTQARARLDAEASMADKEDLLRTLTTTWLNYRPAWKLQILTDLSQLPDYNDRDDEGQGSSGHPVDSESRPVFFALPESYEKAANDGERLRWLIQEFGALSPRHALAARGSLASIAHQWLGTSTLGALLPEAVEPLKQLGSITSVHTLAEDETTAQTAVGPQRFKLPADYAFLPIYRELLASDLKDNDMIGLWSSYARMDARQGLVSELLLRRQFVQAAEVLTAELKIEKNKDLRMGLKAQLEQITGNWGRFESSPAQPAGKEAVLSLVFRNTTKASFTARRVDVAKMLEDYRATVRSKPNDDDYNRMNFNNVGWRLMHENGSRYLSKPVAEWSQALEPAAKHWDKRVSLTTPLKDAGAYLIEATFNGEHITRGLLWIEGMTIVQTRLNNALHCYACDAVTGAPVADAELYFFGWKREWQQNKGRQRGTWTFSFKEFKGITDATGSVHVDSSGLNNDHEWLISAKTADGRVAYHGMERIWFPGEQEQRPENFKVFGITDRPVYRPGQEVKLHAWARAASYDPKQPPNPYAGINCSLIIYDPKNEKLSQRDLKVDDAGGLEESLKLAADATLGAYHAQLLYGNGMSGYINFRVEEYKKPEFEVKVDAPEAPVALGEAFEVKVKAEYYFGGAVKEGTVKYKVMRNEHTGRWYPYGPWDWLYGAGYGWRSLSYDWYPGYRSWCVCMPRWPWGWWQPNPPELIAQGESAIGADGVVKIKLDTALAKELHGDQDHRYEITAEVTDQSRRTIFGSGTVLAARHAFQTFVQLNRGVYFTGDKAQAAVYARTLDGHAVKASGTLKVYTIRYAADGTPQEEALHSLEVKTTDADKDAPLDFTFPKPGQYRVEATLKDEAGHTITASEFTLVRGEAMDTVSLHFNALELSTAKSEFTPGEEVDLHIATNRPGSTVALFVRGMAQDPVWLHLDGKTATHHLKLSEADQPNIFVEAFTVSEAKLHRQTLQLLLPPRKRIATVELTTDKPAYLPRDQAHAKVRVKDQDGKPFIGRLVLTGYDKALEYISGGSNVPDIRPYFWGWKRAHRPQIQETLRVLELGLQKDKEPQMEMLGLGAYGVYGWRLGGFNTYSGKSRTLNLSAGGMMTADALGFAAAPPAPASAAAPAEGKVLALGGFSGADFAKAKAGRADVPAQDGESGATEPVMIRSNLADSAIWLTSLKTNAEGETTFDMPMPDNLTTWKLRGWVMGPDTQVGEATVEVKTRKDLMVRLQAPRFFVEKDEVVISANVHNESGKEMTVGCELLINDKLAAAMDGSSPPALALLGPAMAPCRVKAGGEQRFDWRMKVIQPGEVSITVKALGDGASDAMQMTFPVHEHGTDTLNARSLALRPDQTSGVMTLTVPAERKPESAVLEVHYSPTLAMAMIDALPYLADYPYGCIEQTMNRFVPSIVALRTLKDMNINLEEVRTQLTNLNAQEIGKLQDRAKRWQHRGNNGRPRPATFDEAEVKRMARSGMNRLLSMRNDDGGWSWFPGGRESSPHMTAVVVHGLLTATNTTLLDRRDDILVAAINWLEKHEQHELYRLNLPKDHHDHKTQPDDLDAFIHSVLVEGGKGDKAMRDRVYTARNDLSRCNVARLGLAFDAVKETERRDMCLRNVRQFLEQDDENQTAYLKLPNQGWWYWWNDEMETQAAFLKLLCKVEPKGELSARVAKYLLNNRRHGSYWNSTRDTAAVIEALALFVQTSGEAQPDVKIELLLDGKSVKQVQVTRANLFTFDGTFMLTGDEVTTGEHRIEIRKSGSSPLYANAYLTLFSKEDPIPAAGLEVKVQRKYYLITEEKTKANVEGSRGQVVQQQGLKDKRQELASGTPLKSGDTVEVELHIESKNDYEYVMIADPKPAGFEAISVRSGWTYEDLPSYQEFRDDKVAFFADRLSRGVHVVKYRVKAEVPGLFSALPAKAEAMYAPELRGNSAEWKAKIGE